jgi:hypothetical protein
MARYQYRVAGTFDWMSNSGNAILAVMNQPGSGNKITIRSVELTNLTYANNATTGTITSNLPIILRVERDPVLSAAGAQITPVPTDTNASAWPSTVFISTNSSVITAGTVLGRVTVAKQMVLASQSWYNMQLPQNRFGGIRIGPKRHAATPVENYTIRAGEEFAVYPNAGVEVPVPVRVQATIIRNGSPNRTFTVNYFTQIISANSAILAIDNQAGSGETIRVVDISVTEVGTYDSPYFQAVPVGSLDATSASDSLLQIAPLKMDTASPDPTSWVKVYKDVAILPYGLPENALSEASAGSPKGSNYLKAKDFIGPQYRAYFPEFASASTLRLPDSLGYGMSHEHVDIGIRRAGVTVREGEGFALVSAAETAAGANPAGLSGWSSWHIAITYDVEPKYEPTLTITGLVNPTEIRIYDAGTTTEVAGQENVTSGTFTWQFDPEEYPAVDISIISLNRQNIRLLNQALSLADLTIPVQQQIDRQYGNA